MAAIEPGVNVEPYLSIVLTGRNDDFGGDFNGRMFAAAEFNHRNLEDRDIAHEYVLVEWNPVPGKRLLAELVGERFPWWRRDVVDPAWHAAPTPNPRLAFMEFFAKNVGVRRARGQFVLTTNTDVWFSRGVLAALARRRLEVKVLYRCVRVDLRREIGYHQMSFEILEHPESVLRANLVTPPYYSNAAGGFFLLDRESYLSVGGFNEVFRQSKIHKDSNFCHHVVSAGYRAEVLGEVFHFDHESSWNNVWHTYDRLHTDAPFGPHWGWQTPP